ncbi:MAG: hypothetical protein A2571_01405 [Candidatus Vogelbacteria bacterium RIFOXYD1_FULL_44_32]|uniref:Methyltransferase FkbM domain-containing protein n=1 Tax=Candidatus Vogelbacteria bacterium RIFOXYD1_FULL_44_32 TaxID=1802438 RepID=A0A1G2QFA8_9BACT|nr:MAG: hypothetical protein A2571_01405 [Candidatus Vogelbacteria bacterium RIFOXYD1_FULL_44_32]
MSYSQCGEDLIIEAALATRGIRRPTYLDIGSNYPVRDNNTFLFYTQGNHGVCVEPDPKLCLLTKKIRKNDICLNLGVAPVPSPATNFYVMKSKSLSTFRQDEADRYIKDQKYGSQSISEIIKIPLATINELLIKYFPTGLDLLSLDTEGYDEEIISSLNFKIYRPKVICIETLRYNAAGHLEKQANIIEKLRHQGYTLFGDTYINSIFLDTNYETI